MPSLPVCSRPRSRRRYPAAAVAWLTLSSAPALAHLPHDEVAALAVSPEFSQDGSAMALLPIDTVGGAQRWTAAMTTDGGKVWSYLPGPPAVGYENDNLVYAAWSEEGPLVADRQGHLWIYRDGWFPLAGPETGGTRALVVQGQRIVLLGSTGIWWASSVDGPWELSPVPGAFRVSLDPISPVVALVQTGNQELVLVNGDVQVPLPPVPALVLASVLVDGTIYAGVDGAAFRLDEAGWVPCGRLPSSTLAFANRTITLMSGDTDGTVWVGTGQNLFSTADRCDTFQEHRPFPYDADYASWGGVISTSYVGIGSDEGRVMTAGYRGVSTLSDGRWELSSVLGADVVRGAAFAQRYPEEPYFFLASYGGGVVRTDNFAETWSGSALGLNREGDVYGRGLASFRDTLFWAGDIFPSTSSDGGRSFEPGTLPIFRVLEFEAGEDLWATGQPADGSALAWTSDGLTWTTVSPPVTSWARVRELWLEGSPALVVVTQNPPGLLASWDRGERFETLSTDGSRVSDVVSWPPGEGNRLIRTGPTGIFWKELAADVWYQAEGPSSGQRLEIADDGTLFAADDEARVWRSMDGGQVWNPVLDPVRGGLTVLEAAPGFAQQPVVIVAGYGGVLVSHNRGESWARLQTLNRVELPTCVTPDGYPCTTWASSTAGGGGGVTLLPGDVAWIGTEASAVRWLGSGTAPLLRVDGEPRGPVSAGEWTPTVLSGVVEAPRQRRIELEAGPDGVQLDALELWTDGARLVGEHDDGPTSVSGFSVDSTSNDSQTPPATPVLDSTDEDCACGSAPATGGWALPGVMLVVIRRRRRRRC